MRLIFASFLLLLAVSAQCQQPAEDWHNKCVDLYAQGKYDEAVNAYDAVIRLSPNDTAAWINKGNALCMLDKYDEAITCYDEAIRLDPSNTAALSNQANALNALRRIAETGTSFTKAEDRSENYDTEAYDEAIKLIPALSLPGTIRALLSMAGEITMRTSVLLTSLSS